jgi:hypothetical protein
MLHGACESVSTHTSPLVPLLLVHLHSKVSKVHVLKMSLLHVIFLRSPRIMLHPARVLHKAHPRCTQGSEHRYTSPVPSTRQTPRSSPQASSVPVSPHYVPLLAGPSSVASRHNHSGFASPHTTARTHSEAERHNMSPMPSARRHTSPQISARGGGSGGFASPPTSARRSASPSVQARMTGLEMVADAIV